MGIKSPFPSEWELEILGLRPRNLTSLRNWSLSKITYSRSTRTEKPGYIKHRASIGSIWDSTKFPQKVNQKGLHKTEKNMFAKAQDRWSTSGEEETSLPQTKQPLTAWHDRGGTCKVSDMIEMAPARWAYNRLRLHLKTIKQLKGN